jgi:hypothetical protein
MNNIPMASNPRTGVGVHGTGSFTSIRATLNGREFLDNEINRVHTLVRLELPFALHGIAGLYIIGESCMLKIAVHERPKGIAGYNIGLPEVDKATKHMKLDPDNWGHVNFTEAILEFDSYKPINPPKGIRPRDHDYNILKICTGILNQLLDWYSLATENYSITRVSPRDFVRYEAWHTLPPDLSCFNYAFVHFPTSMLSFEAPGTEGDLELREKVLAFGKVGDEYSLAYRLYAEARRAFLSNDARLAVIQAISSLEVALSFFIRSRVKEDKDSFGKSRISMKAYEDTDKDLTLSIMLKILFPLVVPKDIPFPKDAVDACDRLRKSRNYAIHDPLKFDPSPVERDLWAVEAFLKFLIAQEEHSVEKDNE